jgi:hypothetical protein
MEITESLAPEEIQSEKIRAAGRGSSRPACLTAEDVDWNNHTICYTRAKLKFRGDSIKPALIRFGAEIAVILKRRPATGQLFPYLATVRAGDRATEFKQRCTGLKISGVSLHSYRYAWAERAKTCGYATPLPQLTGELATLAARVDKHLKIMGVVWK